MQVFNESDHTGFTSCTAVWKRQCGGKMLLNFDFITVRDLLGVTFWNDVVINNLWRFGLFL